MSRPTPRRADVVAESGMCASRDVVFRVLIGAAFGFVPALKRRQTLTLPAKLIDSRDAVCIGIARRFERRRLAVCNGRA